MTEFVKLKELKKGDTFWLLHRGFIVMGHEKGRVRSLCLDDDGEPLLDGEFTVEVVSRSKGGAS